jgi:hypothetical protein
VKKHWGGGGGECLCNCSSRILGVLQVDHMHLFMGNVFILNQMLLPIADAFTEGA